MYETLRRWKRLAIIDIADHSDNNIIEKTKKTWLHDYSWWYIPLINQQPFPKYTKVVYSLHSSRSISSPPVEARAPMRRDAAEIINSDPATVAKCLGVFRTLGCWKSGTMVIFHDFEDIWNKLYIYNNDWDWGDSLQCLGCYYDSYWDQKREKERERDRERKKTLRFTLGYNG